MKNTTKQTNRALTIMAMTALVVAVVALATCLYALVRWQNYDAASMEQELRQDANQVRLRFCYDQQITPCDDASINKWNSAHPNEAFRTGQTH